ncbi:hypothetical protein C8R46DRAFT_1353332 [Mycena filopes]|nr:hypothetical protein C8R46DRAFT_1353332 [Mycena filopes]
MLPILMKNPGHPPGKLLPRRGTLFASHPEALGFNRLRWAALNFALLLLPLAIAFCGLFSLQSRIASVASSGELFFAIGYFVLSATSGLMFGATLFFPRVFRYHVIIRALLNQHRHRSHYSFMSQRRMKREFGRPSFTIFILGVKASGSMPIVVTNETFVGQVYAHLASKSIVPRVPPEYLYFAHGRRSLGWGQTMGKLGLGPLSHLCLRMAVPGGSDFNDNHSSNFDGTTFDEAEEFSQGDITAYRSFVFPPDLAVGTHDPFFSVEKASTWITSFGFQLFLTYDDSAPPAPPWIPKNASPTQLKAYRQYILNVRYVDHAYFTLESLGTWVNPEPFNAYMTMMYGSFEDYRGRRRESTPSSRAPSRTASSAAGSRASSRVSFAPSSRASSPDSFAASNSSSRPPSAMSMYSLPDDTGSDNDNFPDLDNLSAAVARRAPAPPVYPYGQETVHKSRGKGKGKMNTGDIQITRQQSVDTMLDLSSVGSTWTVPRTPTAIRLDMSQSLDTLTLPDGRVLNIDSFIRSEDQDSWDGPTGHAVGDVDVYGFYPEQPAQAIRCRRCTFDCKGIDVCQLLDPNLFAGCERFEPDLEGMQDLWRHELDANEHEAESFVGIIARFYTRIVHSTCKVKPACTGVPKLVRLSRPYAGKTLFVGCSNWSRIEKNKHIYWPIPDNVNEDDLRFVMEHDGLLPPARRTENTNETCALTVHRRLKLKYCRFSHVIDGKIIPATMQHRECPTRMLIFVPVHDLPATRHKAILILENPHNHPMHPKIKPNAVDRHKLGKAIEAAGLTGLTTMKLLNAASTSMVYGGSRVSTESPAFTNTRKVRDFISAAKKKEYPRGLGWDGVLYRMSTQEVDLPQSEQYIHMVMAKNGFRLAVTMHPQIAMYIQRVLYLTIDYTFQRIEGKMDEWEVAAFIDRFHRRITFASLYCDTKTDDAFEQLFIELFAAIKRLTGETFKLAPFYPDAKCRIFILDGEVAQAQGLGKFLVNYNDPEISGITTRDPIKILSECLKTCSNHFERHIDELPVEVSRPVIDKLKSIMILTTQEEIDEWHQFAAAQTIPEVHNWYLQKLANPWILPSVNKYLSNISNDNWAITPNHSNLVETAHAGRNAETSTGVALLTGIMQAEARDDIIAAELIEFTRNGVMRHRFNGSAEREKLSAQRRIWRMRKTGERNDQITGYEGLQNERDSGIEESKSSLERQRELEHQIKLFQAELKIDKRRTDIKEQMNDVRKEVEQEKAARREWVIRRTEIDLELKALRSGPLAGTRINGRRPTERPTGDADPVVAQDSTTDPTDIPGADDESMPPSESTVGTGFVGSFASPPDESRVPPPEPVVETGLPGPFSSLFDESGLYPSVAQTTAQSSYLPEFSIQTRNSDVTMEDSSNFSRAAAPLDFTGDFVPVASGSMFDLNDDDFLARFGVPPFNSGSTYDLPPLPPPPVMSAPPSPTVPAAGNQTRKRKAKDPEVDERDIIPGGRAARTRAKTRRATGEE